jgi:hypothetical protein
MDDQGTGASSPLQGGLGSSDDGEGGSSGRTTPPSPAPNEPTGSQQTCSNDDIELLAAYLVKEKAPKGLHDALERIRDAFERRVEPTETSKAIHTLQEAVQKLATKIETNTKEQNTQELGSGRYSYTAVARRGAPVYTEQSHTEQSHIEPEKAVPA